MELYSAQTESRWNHIKRFFFFFFWLGINSSANEAQQAPSTCH